MQVYSINQRVKISNPKSEQHDRIGIVVGFASESKIYQVELNGQFVFCDEQSLADGTFDWEIF